MTSEHKPDTAAEAVDDPEAASDRATQELLRKLAEEELPATPARNRFVWQAGDVEISND